MTFRVDYYHPSSAVKAPELIIDPLDVVRHQLDARPDANAPASSPRGTTRNLPARYRLEREGT